MAEEVGFEPTVRSHARRFSRPVQSTTLPLLRSGSLSRAAPILEAAAGKFADAPRRASHKAKAWLLSPQSGAEAASYEDMRPGRPRSQAQDRQGGAGHVISNFADRRHCCDLCLRIRPQRMRQRLHARLSAGRWLSIWRGGRRGHGDARRHGRARCRVARSLRSQGGRSLGRTALARRRLGGASRCVRTGTRRHSERKQWSIRDRRALQARTRDAGATDPGLLRTR